MDRIIKVMIVDDHEVVRLGLKAALEPESDIEVVADAGGADAALQEAETARPDVVLMDVRMPETDGIQACRLIRESLPETAVLMLTSYRDDEAVLASIMAGASGYLLKNAPRSELLRAIRRVAAGESLLDPAVTTRVLDELKRLAVAKETTATAPARARQGDEQPDFQGPGTTLTIMFTDIVGSTALTERLGDLVAKEVFGRHDDVVRSQTRLHGGTEVKSLGDGFMLTFPSAHRGVSCAVAIQREMTRENDRHPEVRVSVRIGLSVGEPLTEEMDLFGRSVVIAERICSEATSGQVLASDLARTLLSGAREFRFEKLGEFQLKGISDAHSVHEVVWDRRLED